MQISEAIEQFRQYIATERRLSKGTVVNYMNDVNALVEYAGVTEVEDLSARLIRSWQMSLLDSGKKASTVKKMLSSISAWFKFMHRQGWVTSAVMAKIKPPKTSRRLPVFFKVYEVEKIYSADTFPDDYFGFRDKMVLRMLYETGMRRSELAGLTLDRIDINNRFIKVLGKGNKERIIPVEAELLNALNQYLAAKEEAFPGNPDLLLSQKGKKLSTSQIYGIVRHYMSSLSSAPRVSPHVFRHSFATHMLNEGANIDAIKELLGHTDLMATEIYTHVTREHLKEAYRQAHPRAAKGKRKK